MFKGSVVSESLLRVKNLKTHFRVPRGIVCAVDDISFSLAEGETVGLVGESGCGKSTLGKSIGRIIRPTSGQVYFKGTDIASLSRRALQPFRKNIQFVFQDPYASLNPRSRVQRILEEPLIVHGVRSRKERMDRIAWLVDRVGISREYLSNFPHEFSGGQRQRIGIARALALEPQLIICDEPVSALDVSVQAQVLNLLADIQKEMRLTSLFITHDFSVVKYISDRIMVMYLGKIVEVSEPQTMWDEPLHPYTQALISAVPVSNPEMAATKSHFFLTGDIPSQIAPPPGCRFHTRCPEAMKVCAREEPGLVELTREGRPRAAVACHLYTR
jgi:oligopeptide transport system ATP-binding protein